MVNHFCHGYDRLANHYHLLEKMMFGERLKDARTVLLDAIPRCESALVLGDGNGQLLEALLTSQTTCQITSIDQSERMLELQQKRLADHPSRKNVTWLHRDARTWNGSDRKFDLVVAAFFLDCFTRQELATHLPDWINALRPGGHFYFVDFQEPERGWKRLRGKLYLTLMHQFFRWQTNLPNRRLVNMTEILDQFDLHLLRSENMHHDLICARLYRKLPADRARDGQ